MNGSRMNTTTENQSNSKRTTRPEEDFSELHMDNQIMRIAHESSTSSISPSGRCAARSKKPTRPVKLRGIRVASKQELMDAAPVVFHWKYKMDAVIIV